MNIYRILPLIGLSLMSGCSLLSEPQPGKPTEPAPNAQTDASSALANGFDDFSLHDSSADFSRSYFVVNDFMSVVERVPDFIPGTTRFSSALPRTRYGEILLEALRQKGFAIVLGDTLNVPALRYTIELPVEHSPDVHTFFLSLGGLELKRSYEIFGERIAPVSDMLMAGIDPATLRPLKTAEVVRNTRSIATTALEPTEPSPVAATDPGASTALTHSETPSAASGLSVQRINELVKKDKAWDPMDVNLYETGESVYEPMFADSTHEYENIAREVLVFPNDSLVLGDSNKRYLFELAEQVKQTDDVIRLVGCSHGKSQISDGNEKLAKGRAVRVREELLLAGVAESAVLHEACWANVHFDEKFPRRGVVVLHLRPSS